MRKFVTAFVLLLLARVAAAEFMPELRRAPESKQQTLLAPAAGVDSVEQWKPLRDKLLLAWREIIGPFPDRVPLQTQIISSESLDDHTRTLVRYRTDAATSNEAYILAPKDVAPGAKLPGMVVLHPTSPRTINDPVGISGRETVHQALHLVRRGYVCIVPRNFLWTMPGKTYEKAAASVLATQPWKTGIAKMTWDAIRATDLLLAQPDVDPERIGCIGHSLGGKEALYHAAFDERIKAAVGCEGGVGIAFSNWDAPWYLGPQVKSPDFKRDHQELLALVAPRALLIIGGESADGARSWPFVGCNLALWKLFGAEDRIGLLRHAHGHDFPPPGEERERVYRWVDHFLER
jgi:pimeloyl-ACP methyl ester carboxylesterase